MNKATAVRCVFFIASFLSLSPALAQQEDKIESFAQRLEALEKASSPTKTQFGGLVEFNTALYQIDEDLASDKRPDLEGGANFRRLRYDARGKLDGGFSYRLQLDFSDENLSLQNIHINYDLTNAQIRVGNVKTPQSHEFIMSASHIFFVERSLSNDAFRIGRQTGAEIQGDLNRRFTYHTGIYTDATGARESDERAPIYTGARLTTVAFEDDDKLLHLGGHFVHSTGEKDPRFRTGPESNISRIRPIDTNRLSDSHQVHRYGAELITLFSGWRLSYEYTGVDVQGRDVSFNGHMLEVAANLTGEKREYSHSSGTLKGPELAGPFGALELAFRTSWVDLNDSPTAAEGVAGGKGLAMAANLAWIPVKNLHFAAEVGRLDLEQVRGLADQKIDQYQLKALVSF